LPHGYVVAPQAARAYAQDDDNTRARRRACCDVVRDSAKDMREAERKSSVIASAAVVDTHILFASQQDAAQMRGERYYVNDAAAR